MGLMMDKKDLKKLLAGLSLVALIGGAGLTVSGCVTTGSSSGGSDNQASSTSVDDEGNVFTG
jgi:radical SAM modification target selenobiotic family peptide